VFLCKCFHFEHSHRLCIGKCAVENCICERFENGSIEFCIKIYEVIEVEEYKGGLF